MITGTQIHLELPPSAGSDAISSQPPQTLQDLLEVLQKREFVQKEQLGMLRSTAEHLSSHLAKSPSHISIGELVDAATGFKTYLQDRRLKRNSVRSYLNYLRILLQMAKQCGWTQESTPIVEAWDHILTGLQATFPSCRGIVRYAVLQGKTPATFTEVDLGDWFNRMISAGRSYKSLMKVRREFRRFIFQSGLGAQMPGLCPPENRHYGVTMAQLPELLRTEIENLLAFKMALFSPGRSHKSRHREVTALGLQQFFRRVYGFLRNVKGERASSLRDLVTKDHFVEYVAWCLNERKNRSRGLAVMLGKVRAALRTYPPLQGFDLKWIPQLISDLPEDPEELTRAVKQRKWVPYDELSQIPQKIKQQLIRSGGQPLSKKRQALIYQAMLIISWFLMLPWRQRNVRQMKLGSFEEGGNLWKTRVPALATIAKSGRVEEALRANPQAEFWQFYFRSEETKTHHTVHAFLPKQLVPLVEEFLEHHRPYLIRERDPGTLFITRQGTPFTEGAIRNLVGQITLRYTG